MKIAVISDLHLGARDEADGFGHDDSQFLRFLSLLESSFERIVLLGDIWETLASKQLWDPASALREAREAHPEIARRFERPCYTYVHGNHDIVASMVENTPSEARIHAHGTRLLFVHGHGHDVLLNRAPWISELGVWLGGWIRRFGLGPVYRAFDMLDRVRSGATTDAERSTFQRWAVNLAHTRAADVIVTGHTHVATRAEHGDRLFLNSGSCSGGNYTFLSLDTGSGIYGVHGDL